MSLFQLKANNQSEARLKTAYLANILWAGVPGLIALFFPRVARKYIWGQKSESKLERRMNANSLDSGRILGSLWLSIGLLSAYGLKRPREVAGILPLQMGYKSVWLGAVAIPELIRGRRSVLPLALSFGGVAAALWALTPTAEVLAPKEHPMTDEEFGRALTSDRVSPPWSPLER